MSDGCRVHEAEAGDLGLAAEGRGLKRASARVPIERKTKGERREQPGKGRKQCERPGKVEDPSESDVDAHVERENQKAVDAGME